MSQAETRGKWIAAHVSGAMAWLPDPDRAAEIEAHRAYQRRIYLDSGRYVLEVKHRTHSA
ncbi:hypothetical protein [Pseudooceanicola sp.]|uniref:hypothetical protein n=1 Tax=Pseudooceanicola sp. TaxID=1914328 RepID=UPI002623D42E|nr:hypothetical protein [Pseudooceanicola sp.]MDF1854623.1 hypothetical protein [Pseudooceanicola sp.]